jgi:hypothetical protein
MLLHSQRVVSAALVAVVISYDHTMSALDQTNTSYNIARGNRLIAKLLVACQLPNFKKRGAFIKNGIDTLSGLQLISLLSKLSILWIDVHYLLCDLVKLLILFLHSFVVQLVPI